MDQTKNAGTWVSLGKLAFTQGPSGQSVSLAESSSGTVVADAVVKDDSGDTNTAHHNFSFSYDGLNRVTKVAEVADQ